MEYSLRSTAKVREKIDNAKGIPSARAQWDVHVRTMAISDFHRKIAHDLEKQSYIVVSKMRGADA
jgi:hypothetical protein